MDSPKTVVQANIDAYNTHDLDAYIATFTPAATFGQLGGRILLDSRDAMQGFYKQFFDARPSVHCEIKQRSVIGPFVIDLQEISDGKLSTEGQPAMQAMVISEVREGRITKIWYSPLTDMPPGDRPAH
jgi:hypothetical protein